MKKYFICADATLEIKARTEEEAIKKAEKKSTRLIELSNFIISDVEDIF